MCVQLLLVFVVFFHGQTFAVLILKDIYILGLFPMEGAWKGGLAVKPAAEVAIDYVNRHKNILPGYRLNMKWRNTKCNPGLGVKRLADMLCNDTTYITVLGAGCSAVSEVVAEAAQFWNLIQMAEHLGKLAIERNITHNSYKFTESPKLAVDKLKEADARIIVGGFYEEKARQVFCEAFKVKFSGPNIVWILPPFDTEVWWEVNDTDCTGDEILIAAGNFFVINVFLNANSTKPDDNGITWQQFMNDYRNRTDNKKLPGYNSLLTGYDAIWVIARALNTTMNDLNNTGYGLEDFSYRNKNMSELIKNNTRNVFFKSISSDVAFYKNGNALRIHRIYQYQEGTLVTVALYDRSKVGNELTWMESVLWAGGVVPGDSVKTVIYPILLPKTLYIIMFVLASLGILMALCLIVFNTIFRKTRIIKMSSPNINNIILIGCILSYSHIFVETIDTRKRPYMCEVTGSFLVVGFSLVFGGLFAKIWRVYIIFTKTTVLGKWTPKDLHLCLIIGLFTGINITIMVMWSIISPSYPLETLVIEKRIEDLEHDTVMIPLIWHCTSKLHSLFNSILIGFQAVVLALGIFLAVTTRKVSIDALNDSRSVGMCIYNVIVLAVVGLPISLVTNNDFTTKYGVLCTLIIIGTTITQCILFVPKVLALLQHRTGSQECSRPFSSLKTLPSNAEIHVT